MEAIAQNNQKCFIFIVVPRVKKILIRLEQKEEYSTLKKSCGISNNKNNDNNNKNDSTINNNVKI